MDEAVTFIEGGRWSLPELINDTKAGCFLKWLKLSGIDDQNKIGVKLISHPAILPLYVLAPQYKIMSDVPKEFRMTYFERYMKVESQVRKYYIA